MAIILMRLTMLHKQLATLTISHMTTIKVKVNVFLSLLGHARSSKGWGADSVMAILLMRLTMLHKQLATISHMTNIWSCNGNSPDKVNHASQSHGHNVKMEEDLVWTFLKQMSFQVDTFQNVRRNTVIIWKGQPPSAIMKFITTRSWKCGRLPINGGCKTFWWKPAHCDDESW